MIFRTSLHWTQNDDQPVVRNHATETMARDWAAQRSTEVAGFVSLLVGDNEVNTYHNGVKMPPREHRVTYRI